MVKECILKWLMTRSCNGTACLLLPMTKIHVFALHKCVIFTDKRNLQSYSIVNNMATLTFGERTVFCWDSFGFAREKCVTVKLWAGYPVTLPDGSNF
jgi:hypothetical protein